MLAPFGHFVPLRVFNASQDKPSVKHVTVLGGGFVGCEVALAVAKRGRERGMVVSHVSGKKNTPA